MANSLRERVAKKKQAIAASSGRRQETVKPKPGKSRYRLLPHWLNTDEVEFWHDFGNHFIKNQAGKLLAVYVCVDKTYGKPCSVCAGLDTGIANAGSDELLNALKDGKSQARVLMNAIDRDSGVDTPVILDLTPTTFDQVLDIIQDDENYEDGDSSSYNPVTDLAAGLDITITREGVGLNTKYKVKEAKKRSSVDPSIMSQVANLDDHVKQEHDAGRNKALAAVSSVSGLLPPPTQVDTDQDSPSSESLNSLDEEFDSDVPDFVSTTEAVEEADDVPFEVDTVPVSEDMSDDELSGLLDELG